MNIIPYISVFGIGMLEIWAAVPFGFVLKLNPWILSALSASGGIAGAAIVIFGGDRIRQLFKSRVKQKKQKGKKKNQMIIKIWQKYGVIGLGLIAPWVTGVPLGAALGIAFKAEPVKLFISLSAGTIICVAVFVLAGSLGLELFLKK